MLLHFSSLGKNQKEYSFFLSLRKLIVKMPSLKYRVIIIHLVLSSQFPGGYFPAFYCETSSSFVWFSFVGCGGLHTRKVNRNFRWRKLAQFKAESLKFVTGIFISDKQKMFYVYSKSKAKWNKEERKWE